MTADDIRKMYAKNLRKMMREMEITDKELAYELQLPDITVQQWVRAKTIPSTQNMAILCDFFKAPLRLFFLA